MIITKKEIRYKNYMRENQIFWYPDGEPDLFQNLMGSKLDQDPYTDFFSVLLAL